ncbi:hypothetical protein LCGC14_0614580 [marine sediment metagenome]|uniref:Uncharacterized protein n=1 Tax=marine sediment metagenome TaxID=412755 RepID=A0A0F9UF26_9ZZZZ
MTDNMQGPCQYNRPKDYVNFVCKERANTVCVLPLKFSCKSRATTCHAKIVPMDYMQVPCQACAQAKCEEHACTCGTCKECAK